jgi:glutamyl/glutaminyl-tRNA synthetase
VVKVLRSAIISRFKKRSAFKTAIIPNVWGYMLSLRIRSSFIPRFFKGIKGKNLYMPIRIALTGQNHGPDMKATMSILGKELIEKRINYSIKNYC